MWKDEFLDLAAPEHVEMFVVRDFSGDGVSGELFEHDVDVDQGVGAAVDQCNGRSNILRREPGHLVEAAAVGQERCSRRLNIIVIHLEAAVAHNLEPVDHRLDRRVRIQMSIRRQFLRERNIVPAPVEERDQGGINNANKDGGI